VALFQDVSALVDSAVLCRFLQFALGISTIAEMLRTVTGLDFGDEELMTIGRRIYTLERQFNNRAGFSRGDDTCAAVPQRGIPDRILPPSPGSSRGDAGRILRRSRLGPGRRSAAADAGGAGL